MSALPPKADMFSVEIDVCFVPKADIQCARSMLQNADLFRSRINQSPKLCDKEARANISIDDERACSSALISRSARIHRFAMGHSGDAVGFNDSIAIRVIEGLVRKSFDGVVHSRRGVDSMDISPPLHFFGTIDRADRCIGGSMPAAWLSSAGFGGRIFA